MNSTTLYDILQVSPHAEPEVIAAAGKALQLKYHPDKNPGKDYSQEIRQINDAKDRLTDVGKRNKYDAALRDAMPTIGNYKIIKQIAEGGFGRVYIGEHTTLGEKVCIKQNMRVSGFDRAQFLNETKLLWNLRHHSLPAVRDFYSLADGSCALVMTYIGGPTLEQIVDKYKKKGQTLEPEHVCWMTERVLDALRYMHYHGVVHGDVKPQNIIIQPQEHTCALVDLGLSKYCPTSDSQADGYTPGFASPEHLANKPLLPESDLYSVGLTMIYSFGGDPRARKIPASVPKSIRDFISELIVFDVKQRPNWETSDLVHKMREVRIKEFGRESSGFKKLQV